MVFVRDQDETNLWSYQAGKSMINLAIVSTENPATFRIYLLKLSKP